MRTDGKDCTLFAGILLSLLTYLIILRRHFSPHYPAIYWNLGALTTLEMADESSFESEFTPGVTLIMDDEESPESDFGKWRNDGRKLNIDQEPEALSVDTQNTSLAKIVNQIYPA